MALATTGSTTLLWATVMFLGTVLFEAIAFRGFLYPQLILKLRRSLRAGIWAAVLAGIASQAILMRRLRSCRGRCRGRFR